MYFDPGKQFNRMMVAVTILLLTQIAIFLSGGYVLYTVVKVLYGS